MHRARGDNHDLRPYGHREVASTRLDTGRRPALDNDAAHIAIHDDPRAAIRRVLQVGDQRRLLRAAATSHAAVAASVVLRATAHVAR